MCLYYVHPCSERRVMADPTTDVARGSDLLADLDAAANAWADARMAEDRALDALGDACRRQADALDEYRRAQARYDAWAKAPLT